MVLVKLLSNILYTSAVQATSRYIQPQWKHGPKCLPWRAVMAMASIFTHVRVHTSSRNKLFASDNSITCTRVLDAKQNGVGTLTKASRTMINWTMFKSCICICWANFIYRTCWIQYKHSCQACVFVYCNHMKMAIQYILPDARRLLGGLRGTGRDYIIAHLRRLD